MSRSRIRDVRHVFNFAAACWRISTECWICRGVCHSLRIDRIFLLFFFFYSFGVNDFGGNFPRFVLYISPGSFTQFQIFVNFEYCFEFSRLNSALFSLGEGVYAHCIQTVYSEASLIATSLLYCKEYCFPFAFRMNSFSARRNSLKAIRTRGENDKRFNCQLPL